MELFIELETLKLVTSLTDRRELRSFTIKRGDALPLTVRFLQNQTPTRLDASTVITFALKESGKYDDDPVVLEQTFTASTVEDPDSDPHYTASPSLNTEELSALFSIDSDSSNDPASVTLMGEVSWQATGDDGPTSIKTFSAICENDLFRGDEELPQSVNLGVPGVAATARITMDDSAVVNVQTGTFSVGDVSLNLWDGTTLTEPSQPYLSYSGGATGWETWVLALIEVINTGAVTEADFTLVGTSPTSLKVTASTDSLGANLFFDFEAINVGVAGNSIAYSLAVASSEDEAGTLSGGVDTRFFEQDDFVSTIPDTLTTAQKETAIANLVDSSTFKVSGDIESVGNGNTGFILTDDYGSRYRLTVDINGSLVITSI